MQSSLNSQSDIFLDQEEPEEIMEDESEDVGSPESRATLDNGDGEDAAPGYGVMGPSDEGDDAHGHHPDEQLINDSSKMEIPSSVSDSQPQNDYFNQHSKTPGVQRHLSDDWSEQNGSSDLNAEQLHEEQSRVKMTPPNAEFVSEVKIETRQADNIPASALNPNLQSLGIDAATQKLLTEKYLQSYLSSVQDVTSTNASLNAYASLQNSQMQQEQQRQVQQVTQYLQSVFLQLAMASSNNTAGNGLFQPGQNTNGGGAGALLHPYSGLLLQNQYSSFSNMLGMHQNLNPLSVNSLINKHSPTNNNNNNSLKIPTQISATNNHQTSPLAFKNDPQSSPNLSSQFLSNLLGSTNSLPPNYPLTLGIGQSPVITNHNPTGSFLNSGFKPQPWDLGINTGMASFPLLKRKAHMSSDMSHPASDLIMPKLIKAESERSPIDTKNVKNLPTVSNGDSHNSYRHRCKFCKKPFGSDSALQIHVRSHTGERPFKCNICGNRFTTKGNLKVHFQRHKAKYPSVEMNSNPVPEYLDANFPTLLSSFPENPVGSSGKPTLLNPVHPTLSHLGLIGRSGCSQSPTTRAECSGAFDRCPRTSANQVIGSPQISKLDPSVSQSPDISPLAILSSIADDPNLKLKLAQDLEAMKTKDETSFSDDEDDSDSDQVFVDPSQQPINLTTSAGQNENSDEDEDSLDQMKLPPLQVLHVNPEDGSDSVANQIAATAAEQYKRESINQSEFSNVNSSSETMKLQALVDNIETKMGIHSKEFSSQHLPQTACVCNVCQKVLSCKSALKIHYRIHTGERPYSCEICQRKFSSRGNMKLHQETHKESHMHLKSQQLNQCHVCYMHFDTSNALDLHMKDHTVENTYKMHPSLQETSDSTILNFSSSSLKSAFEKMKQENGDFAINESESKQSTDSDCDNLNSIKTANSQNEGENSDGAEIYSMLNEDEDEKGVKKESESPLGYSGDSSRVSPSENSQGQNECSPHQFYPVGSSAKQHVCLTCSKPFSSASALQIHTRTHTGDKPYKCAICQRAFTTKGNLKVHMGTHIYNGPSRRGRRTSNDPVGLNPVGIPGIDSASAPYFRSLPVSNQNQLVANPSSILAAAAAASSLFPFYNVQPELNRNLNPSVNTNSAGLSSRFDFTLPTSWGNDAMNKLLRNTPGNNSEAIAASQASYITSSNFVKKDFEPKDRSIITSPNQATTSVSIANTNSCFPKSCENQISAAQNSILNALLKT